MPETTSELSLSQESASSHQEDLPGLQPEQIKHAMTETLRGLVTHYAPQTEKGKESKIRSALLPLLTGLGIGSIASKFETANKLTETGNMLMPLSPAVLHVPLSLMLSAFRRVNGESAASIYTRHINIDGKGPQRLWRLFAHGVERKVVGKFLGITPSTDIKKLMNNFDEQTYTISPSLYQNKKGDIDLKKIKHYLHEAMQHELAVESIKSLGAEEYQTEKEKQKLTQIRGDEGTRVQKAIQALLTIPQSDVERLKLLEDTRQFLYKREKAIYWKSAGAIAATGFIKLLAFAGLGDWLTHAAIPKVMSLLEHSSLPSPIKQELTHLPGQIDHAEQTVITDVEHIAKKLPPIPEPPPFPDPIRHSLTDAQSYAAHHFELAKATIEQSPQLQGVRKEIQQILSTIQKDEITLANHFTDKGGAAKVA